MTLHRAHELPARRGTVLLAAVTLGVGMGGLLDGIVFHRILGWHHLVSGVTADPAANRLADGLFDAAAWLVTLLGVLLLWRAWRRWGEPRPTSRLVGGMLAGWGGFTFVESVVDHHVLGLHRVGPSPAWDVVVLAGSLLVLALGVWVARASARRAERAGGGLKRAA